MTRRNVFHLRTSAPDVEEAVGWELEHHVAERVDQLMAAGWTRAAALEEARRAFGDVRRVRAELLAIDRDVARRRVAGEAIETMLQDMKSAWRNIRSAPALTGAIVLTLSLGMGANTALFSVIDALLLRPLPYHAPEELMEVSVAARTERFGVPRVPFAIADRLRGSEELFESSFMHTRGSGLFTGGREPDMISIQSVTPEFEEVLGVRPLLGRGLMAEDGRPGAAVVALLSHGLWQSAFGGDSSAIGRSIAIDDVQYAVIGVMPPRFKFPEYSTTEVWTALRTDGTGARFATAVNSVEIVGRVPASRQTHAHARADAVGSALLTELDPVRDRTVRLTPLQENRARNADLRLGVYLAAGASLLILLVAGLNMLNLLLVRATARTQEIAVRTALGASRARLLRQLATEAMLLALLGGVGAVIFALLALRFVSSIIPDSVVFFAPYAIAVEQRTLLFTFVIAVATGLLFGLLPAFRATAWAAPAAQGALTRYAGKTVTARRLRSVLVGAEVAFSVVLLVGAGLLINSFVRLMRVDPGIELARLAVAEFATRAAARPPGPRELYLQALEEKVESLPGVQGATLSVGLPPSSSFSFGVALQVEGEEPRTAADIGWVPFASVRPDFFDVTGARLLLGRGFSNADTHEGGSVIIDEDLARFLWGEQNPIGARFRMDSESPWLTVVGVMADMKLMGPDERRGDFELLYPATYADLSGQLNLAIRTEGDPRLLLPAVRAAIREVNPNQPIYGLDTAERLYAESVDMPRFLVVLISMLAALALALAAVGQYGLLAHGVEQRRQELAVRVALGARHAHVRNLIIREGVLLVTIGAALGVAGALLAGRVIRNLLYGVEPTDPLTVGIVLFTTFMIAAVATALPAWRATRVSPLEAMRAL